MSSPTNRKELTPEQKAALGPYRARWAEIRRSTEPAERSAAESGARLAYELAGLQLPSRFVWCESPIALSEQARRAADRDGRNVKTAIVHRLRREVTARIQRRLGSRVQAFVQRMVTPEDPLVASAADAVAQAVPHESTSILDGLRGPRPFSFSSVLRGLLGANSFQNNAAGQHDLSWLGAYDYFRHVLGLREETEALRGLTQVAKSAGWVRPHERSCYLAERPDLLSGDTRDRLHHAGGPALRYPDGWSVWAWKGVEVPRWIIEQPDRITLALIDSEMNVQVRRCMIEIMTPGKYVALGGAVRVAEDETGILWRKRWLAADAWAAVEVINATSEPDGTRKHFFLQVPANLRTPREAVAWTYGLQPSAYAKLVVRT